MTGAGARNRLIATITVGMLLVIILSCMPSRLPARFGGTGGVTGPAGPLISRGLPAYTNDPNAYDPSWVDSGNYGQQWDSIDTPSAEHPIWIALDLSSVPTASRQRVVVAWFNDKSDYLQLPSTVRYNLPANYTLDANHTGGGAQPPSSGWVTLTTVTNNTYNQREHDLDLTGYNWLRMTITAIKGSSENNAAAFSLDIYNAAGPQDSWLFLGDSITAEGMDHSNIGGGPWSGGDYAQLVNAATPSFYPIQLNGGMGGMTTAWGAQNIQSLLAPFTGTYVSLAYGTNDANEPYPLSQRQIQGIYASLLSLISSVEQAGKVAVVPYIPWGCNGDLGQNANAINQYVNAHLASDAPAAIRGPDLWAAFQQNPSWISKDCIHPTYTAPDGQLSGFEHYQRVWQSWSRATLYSSGAPTSTAT
jgi:hypothetical protein